MNNRLCFALIGCGKIAPRHAAEMVKHGYLAAVCDIIPGRADAFAAQYAAKAFYSIDDLLKNEKADIVAICTPNGLHAEHTVRALKAGSHVLCEKPLCISSSDAAGMINVARASGKKLFVVKSTRYNPALVSLKQILDTGQLGKLYSFQLNCFWNRPAEYYKDSWRGSRDLDGGTLYTQFSHYIDALLWLFGDMESVSGFRNNMAHQDTIAFEDSGTVAMRLKNGMIGGLNWSLNTYNKNMEVSLSLLAEKGSLRIGGEYMNKLEYELTDGATLQVHPGGTANDYGFYKGSMSNHDKIYENLVRALQDDTHPFTQAADGLKTVETIERIYNSVSLSQ